MQRTQQEAKQFLSEIQAGAAKFTDYFGNDSWQKKIDRDRLDMSSDNWCMVGQLFTSFSSGMNALFPADQTIDNIWVSAKAHGFCTTTLDKRYEILTEEWREYLEASP